MPSLHRYFRVNGIKDEHGIWREYPSGSPVTFSHFPEFQPDHGHEGEYHIEFLQELNHEINLVLQETR